MVHGLSLAIITELVRLVVDRATTQVEKPGNAREFGSCLGNGSGISCHGKVSITCFNLATT